MAKVLVVDDRAENRSLIATILHYAGHESIESADGSEALRQVRLERPDLVICDILMPTMDGYEFVRQVRQEPAIADTEVIFCTATFLEREARGLAESCGVMHVLTKPCDPEEILQAVERALTRTAVGTAMADHFESRHARVIRDKLLQKAEELEAANQRLSALTALNLQLASERDPIGLLDKFCQGARALFGARCAILAARDKMDGDTTHFATAGMAAAEAARVGETRIDAGVFGELLRDGKCRRLPAAETSPVPPMELACAFGPVQSALLVPIASLERVHGWILLVDKLGSSGFGDEDERLLSIHAAQAGRIYENGSLYLKVQRHAAHLELEVAIREAAQKQLAVQHAVALALADARNWERASFEFFRILHDHLSFPVGSIFRVEPPSGVAACIATWSEGSPALEAFAACSANTRFGREEGMIGQVWTSARPFATAELCSEQRFVRAAAAADAGLRSAVFVPVVSHGNIVGVLELFDTKRREFSPQLMQTLDALAGQIGQFMERRHQQSNIERLNRVYAVLSGVNALIVRVRSEKELFHGACQIAVDEGKFCKAWIGALDPDTDRLLMREFRGDDPDYFEKLGVILATRSEAEYGEPAMRLRSGAPLVFNDLEHDPGVLLREHALASGSRALVWLPLVVTGRTTGVLVLHARERDFFNADEMRLLLELAGDLAFALEHIEKADRLDYLAHFDALTGLANANLFLDRLDERLAIAAREQRRLALAIVDISRLDIINKAFGRKIGDGVLKQVAERIVGCAGDATVVARLGGDNFALMIEDAPEPEALSRQVEEQLLGTLRGPLSVDGTELHCSGRAGIALFPRDGVDAKSLAGNAETALGEAKAGSDPYVFYSRELSDRVGVALELESRLRRALEREEFVLHYQPKVDIDNRQLEGFEALIRWNSPESGLVPPLEFIPLLEKTGLIVEVGAWVCSRAVRDYLAWLAQGLFPPRIAVNVSAVQLRRRDFVATLRDILDAAEETPEIDIEVTETTAMEDIAGTIDKLHALYALGVNIAIDDFGTGHSSLTYLSKLPAHVLKIDQSFINTMLDDPDQTSLVSTIIALAHSLRLKVVAEGVETREQANMLRLLRCDQMQGFFIGRPMPFDEATEYIRARQAHC
ncbi:MAG: EAL domain-containing protein [Lysobacteraceae bacterium]|nr:MAG: EAL domain-containing protein [Xanthomonadaceae bacterium]